MNQTTESAVSEVPVSSDWIGFLVRLVLTIGALIMTVRVENFYLDSFSGYLRLDWVILCLMVLLAVRLVLLMGDRTLPRASFFLAVAMLPFSTYKLLFVFGRAGTPEGFLTWTNRWQGIYLMACVIALGVMDLRTWRRMKS